MRATDMTMTLHSTEHPSIGATGPPAEYRTVLEDRNQRGSLRLLSGLYAYE